MGAAAAAAMLLGACSSSAGSNQDAAQSGNPGTLKLNPPNGAIVNGTATPFNGDLLASIAPIKSIGAIPNGGTQKLFVICSSGPRQDRKHHHRHDHLHHLFGRRQLVHDQYQSPNPGAERTPAQA